MNAVPMELHLPDGKATLVLGSFEQGSPCYERNGEVLDVDVSVPDDLAPRWFWQGSFLRLRAEPEACGVAIYTGTFPPPLCFDNARELGRLEAERGQVQAKKVKIKGSEAPIALPDLPIEAIPEPELAHEQGVLL